METVSFEEIICFVRHRPIVYHRAWATNEAHYVQIGFGASVMVSQVNKNALNIDKIYNLIDSSVGFDPDDKEVERKVKESLYKFVDRNRFYSTRVDCECFLTFAGGGGLWGANAFSAFLDEDLYNSLSETAIFVASEKIELVENFVRIFLIGQCIKGIEPLTEDRTFSYGDKMVKFTLSNELFLEANSFALEVPKQSLFLRYTPERGLERNPTG